MNDTNLPISNYDHYCAGYQNPDNQGAGYFLGVCLNVGKVPIKFRHPGSEVLDKINAFDMAEATGTYLGQINMIKVSSFCGLQGQLWGYDIAKHELLRNKKSLLIARIKNKNNKDISVYSAKPILDAMERLIGTRDEKRFPLLPGSHVPCATKQITKAGPCHLYCAIAIGIPQNRKNNACLLMEDIGELGTGTEDGEFLNEYKHNVLISVAKSVLAVGENQLISYKEIFVELVDIVVEGGSMGCALIAAPYFCMAKKAVPNNVNSIEDLKKISLREWESLTKRSYLSER